MLSWAPTRSLSSSGVAVSASVAVSMCRSPVEVGGEAKRGCCSTRSQATRHAAHLRLAATGAADSAGPAIRYHAGPRWTTLDSPVAQPRLAFAARRLCLLVAKQTPGTCIVRSLHDNTSATRACACTYKATQPIPSPLLAVVTTAHLHLSPTRPRSVGSPVRFGQRTERVAHLQRTKALHSH
jgi:hypothetical protein